MVTGPFTLVLGDLIDHFSNFHFPGIDLKRIKDISYFFCVFPPPGLQQLCTSYSLEMSEYFFDRCVLQSDCQLRAIYGKNSGCLKQMNHYETRNWQLYRVIFCAAILCHTLVLDLSSTGNSPSEAVQVPA